MAEFIDLCAESSDDEEQAAALTARLDAEEASLALAQRLQAEEDARGPAPAEAPEEALAEAPPEVSEAPAQAKAPEPAAEEAAPPAKRQKTSAATEPSEVATSAATEPSEAAEPSAASGRVVRIATWNARSVLPEGENKDKLRTTLELLGQPDLLAVQETVHVRKTGKKGDERVDDAKTATHTAKIAAKAAELGYEAFFASPDPAQYKGNDDFCHGTALFVKRDGLLAGGHLVAVPWDHDGHVLCYDHDLGRVVGVYLPTPTKKSRFAGTPWEPPYPQHAVRSTYDRELRSLLLDSGDNLLAFLGDCNVTPTAQDTSGDLWKGKHAEARDRWNVMIRETGLVDAFREKHPTARRYTSYQLPKNQPKSCATKWQSDIKPGRVDLCYVPRARAVRSAEVMDADGVFTTADMTRALRSDHVPVLVEIEV